MRSPALGLPFCLICLGLFGSFVGCKSRGESTGKNGSGGLAAAGSGGANGVGQSAGGATAAPPSSAERRVQLPEGPVLAIQAGKGVGPIRIGATVATIERLRGEAIRRVHSRNRPQWNRIGSSSSGRCANKRERPPDR